MMAPGLIPSKRGRLAQLVARHRHGVLTAAEEQEWRSLVAREGFAQEAATEPLARLETRSLGVMAADILLGEAEA